MRLGQMDGQTSRSAHLEQQLTALQQKYTQAQNALSQLQEQAEQYQQMASSFENMKMERSQCQQSLRETQK